MKHASVFPACESQHPEKGAPNNYGCGFSEAKSLARREFDET
ncbi:hypothetical protein THTE_3748 [Thermogutta terrifontis]|uniref:Uncharacterized protein n=1 Tax=Thermogutta terrifontis TaxID=1331910 RepID=A0A286RK57_9BACT|nr:hypothetical protein THTE_3748 [Thermogutta terrifontis]